MNHLEKDQWYKQAGNIKAYYIFTCCKAAHDCLKGEISFWTIKKMRYMEAFLPKTNFIENSMQAIEEQKKDTNFIDRIMRRSKEKSVILDNFYGKIEKIDLAKLGFEEIRKILHELDKLNYDYWVNSYLCDIFDPIGNDLLKEEISKAGITLTDEELAVFMRTNWLNYAQEERLALSKINNDKGLEQHAKKYFYFENSWESTKVLTIDDFKKRKVENIYTAETDWEKEQEILRVRHNIPNELMNVFYLFRQLSIMRDQRKRHTLITNHYYDKLFKRIAEIFDLSFDDLRVLLVDDIVKDIDSERLKKTINDRKELLIEAYSNKKSELFHGEEARKLYDELKSTFEHKGKIIKGNIACKGQAKGIVKVVRGETHFGKFNLGDILVTAMTRPEFVPIMKKAKAIITDEGGITCHAAIVSRELNVPCIIGTQVATNILNDGMMVEVDADNGIVKVL